MSPLLSELLLLLLTLGLAATESLRRGEVHAFFYLWYGTPEVDGRYMHWDHEVLPHWEERINERFRDVIGTRPSPPAITHSPFYPQGGPYSSKDNSKLQEQIKHMHHAGIDVAVLSWWGQHDKPHATDTQGVNTDAIMRVVLDSFEASRELNVTVAFHIEPYQGRSIATLRDDLRYITDTYGNYSCLHRTAGRLVFYVYDSYHLHPAEWSRLLSPDGDITVRGTDIDGYFVGLWLHAHHGRDLQLAGFDAAYSYFASTGFSHGSSPDMWRQMCSFLRGNGMGCNLSVGPGYNDEGIRPWNAHNSEDRRGGAYFEELLSKALEAAPDTVSVTSWNEWGEGTQIEPAENVYYRDGRDFPKRYLDYGDDGPYKYLNMTAVFSKRFKVSQATTVHHVEL